MDLFATPPLPLTRSQRLLLAVATVLTGLTRFFFLARTPWDWDEILFTLAVRDYSVLEHHPHPPGFPLFIATAKVIQELTGFSDFRALQAINLAAGLLLVPAMFFFCRELRLRFEVSLGAALFLAFMPNVWFFSETAFSDVPSIAIVLAACGLLLAGCRHGPAFIAGALLLGVAAGYRPQNLSIGFAPSLMASWFQFRQRRYGRIVAAGVICLLVVVLSYGGAARESGGWDQYAEVLRKHQEYITQVDSFRNPDRPALYRLVDDFFIRPFRAPAVNIPLALFAAISVVASLIRRRMPVLMAMASFGPFCVAAWLTLDVLSTSRFSIGYAPLLALFAADGVAVVASMTRGRPRVERSISATGIVAILTVMIGWTIPAVLLPRQQVSPPVQAVEWIRHNIDPADAVIYVHGGMAPYVDYFLEGYRLEHVSDNAPQITLSSRNGWYVREGPTPIGRAVNFVWPRKHLQPLVRPRYFEASVVPISGTAEFRDGWYAAEGDWTNAWRWMGRRSVTMLPRMNGEGRLSLRLYFPLDALPGRPIVRILMNGSVLDQFEPDERIVERTYRTAPRADATNELVIETDRTVNLQAAGVRVDPRDLGLRLERLEFGSPAN